MSDKVRALAQMSSKLYAGCAALEVIDLATQKLQHSISTNKSTTSGSIYSLCPLNEQYLLLGRHGGTIQIFDTQSQTITHSIPNAHADVVKCFAPLSSTTFATGSYDCTCKLWDMRKLAPSDTGHACTQYKHKNYVNAIKYLPKHQLIVTASEDGIGLFTQSSHLATFKLTDEALAMIAVQTGQSIAVVAGCKDATMHMLQYNVQTNTTTSLQSMFPKHEQAVTSMDLHGNYMVSASADSNTMLWNVSTDDDDDIGTTSVFHQATIVQQLANISPVRATCFVTSTKSPVKYIATGDQNGTVRISSTKDYV